MSFWRKKEQEYEEMVEAIKQEPGLNPSKLAQWQTAQRAEMAGLRVG